MSTKFIFKNKSSSVSTNSSEQQNWYQAPTHTPITNTSLDFRNMIKAQVQLSKKDVQKTHAHQELDHQKLERERDRELEREQKALKARHDPFPEQTTEFWVSMLDQKAKFSRAK